MAVLKYKDIEKMNEKEIEEKILDLKKELVKANVAGNKGGGKTNIKEIRKAFARLLTLKNSKLKEKKKK